MPKQVDTVVFSTEHTVQAITEAYPNLAVDLIRQSTISEPYKSAFAAEPNSPEQHQPLWHQWGIQDHSIKFEEYLRTTAQDYLKQWNLKPLVDQTLAEEIDGVSKAALLPIAAITHDLGKYTSKALRPPGGEAVWHFGGHEIESGAIIRRGEVHDLLLAQGMTDDQIEYVAHLGEVHYKLGKLRDTARHSATGYTIAFTQTKQFEIAAQEIMAKDPDVALEIGLLFMADSLSKSDVRAVAETDDQIAAQEPTLRATLATRGLSPSLIKGALQMPVSIKAVERYLKLWALGQQPI